MHIHRRPGFTLIELLVVISIIALLIAILLPALKRARVAAQMAAALSNVRQVQIALHNYAYDNQGSLPYLCVEEPGSLEQAWAGQLLHGRYLADGTVFWSPGRDNSMLGNMARRDWDHPYWRYVGFALNSGASERAWLPSRGFPDVERLPLNLDDSDAPPPGEFVSLVDFWVSTTNDGQVGPNATGTAGYDFAEPAVAGTFTAGRYNLFTYNGGVARSYFDRHASGSDSRDLGWKAHTQHLGEWQYTTYDFRHAAPWYSEWY